MSKIIADDLKTFMAGFVGNMRLTDYEVGTYLENGHVMTDQSLDIPDTCIVIPQYMTDWEVDVEVEDNYSKLHASACPGGQGDCTAVEHKGQVKIKVLNHLKAGDKVILMRKPGGQQYLIISRVENSPYKHEG